MPETESKVFKNCLEKTKLMVDVGFGGGFPILPLAFNNPDKKFIGFEARAKKAQVVQKIAAALGLTNAKLMHQRLETVDLIWNMKDSIKFIVTTENTLLS